LSGCKNQFWFDINNLETLEAIINHIKKLDASKIKETAIENRKRYINKYRKEIIQNQYKNAIFKLLKK
jgi:NDP-sugar pyrophosphorylase family protein